jgi:hypothetical protein
VVVIEVEPCRTGQQVAEWAVVEPGAEDFGGVVVTDCEGVVGIGGLVGDWICWYHIGSWGCS